MGGRSDYNIAVKQIETEYVWLLCYAKCPRHIVATYRKGQILGNQLLFNIGEVGLTVPSWLN